MSQNMGHFRWNQWDFPIPIILCIVILQLRMLKKIATLVKEMKKTERHNNDIEGDEEDGDAKERSLGHFKNYMYIYFKFL